MAKQLKSRRRLPGKTLADTEIVAKAAVLLDQWQVVRDEHNHHHRVAKPEAAIAIGAELRWMRDVVATNARLRARFSQKQQRAIRQLAAALYRAKRDLPEDLQFNGTIDWLSRHFAAYALISAKPKADALARRLAAEAAVALCKQFSIKLSTTKGGRTKNGKKTKGSKLCQLTAVLSGDENADLQPYIREALRQEGGKHTGLQIAVSPQQARKWQEAGKQIAALFKNSKGAVKAPEIITDEQPRSDLAAPGTAWRKPPDARR